MTESFEKIQQPRLWRDDNWTARIGGPVDHGT